MSRWPGWREFWRRVHCTLAHTDDAELVLPSNATSSAITRCRRCNWIHGEWIKGR